MTAETLMARIVETMQLVAADVKTQVAAFPPYVVVPDEIALEVGDLVLLLANPDNVADISDDERTALQEIDRIYSGLSGLDHPEEWTAAAMANHPDWRKARELAVAWLAKRGIARRAPKLFWGEYVPGGTQ